MGTSGGIWGITEGYSMMIGGDEEIVETLRPIFETLAPAADKGWGRVGPSGAGHFVKMVHNGIEYGMMQAYAEGFSHHAGERSTQPRPDADLRDLALWLGRALLAARPHGRCAQEESDARRPEAYVPDSGEGRWTVFEAIDLNVSAPVITESLIRRLRSREENNFTDRMLCVMRNEFGGHAVKKS